MTRRPEGTGDKNEDYRQSRIINTYLASTQDRRRRAVNVNKLQERLVELDRSLRADALTPIQRMLKIRDVEQITTQLESVDDRALEDEFVAVIKDWAERHSITYGILRQMNVPVEVLKRAGLSG